LKGKVEAKGITRKVKRAFPVSKPIWSFFPKEMLIIINIFSIRYAEKNRK